MSKLLILLVVALIACGPMLTAALPELCSDSVGIDVAYAIGDGWSFWDCCVLYWSNFMDLTDWPV